MTGGGGTGAVGRWGEGGRGVIFTAQSKCHTNIETLLFTTVKSMILHLLKNVKGLKCLMVFYLDTLNISLYLQQL